MKTRYRIRYRGDQAGEWWISGAMTLIQARKLCREGIYPGAYVVHDEEGWPPVEKEVTR